METKLPRMLGLHSRGGGFSQKYWKTHRNAPGYSGWKRMMSIEEKTWQNKYVKSILNPRSISGSE